MAARWMEALSGRIRHRSGRGAHSQVSSELQAAPLGDSDGWRWGIGRLPWAKRPTALKAATVTLGIVSSWHRTQTAWGFADKAVST